MMTKEEFIRQATVIEDYIESQRKVVEFINKTFYSDSIDTVCDFWGHIIDLAIEQLSILSGFDGYLIVLYLYDNCARYVHEDGFEMEVKNLSDLWDFGMHVKECVKSAK